MDEKTNIIELPVDPIPTDYAISIHMRNLFNTYGHKKVLNTLETLFNLQPKEDKKAS